MRSMVQKTLLT